MNLIAESVRTGAQVLPGVLALRALPFVGFVVVSRGFSWFARLAAATGYGLVSFLAVRGGGTPLHWLLLAYVYAAGAGWAAYELSAFVRSRAAWFGIVLLLFWLFPILAMRPVPSVFLLLGWDFMLATYSWHIDTRGESERAFGDFLFFLLVNPALVYQRRGRRVSPPSLDSRGLMRFALGVFAVFLSVGLVSSTYGQAVLRRPVTQQVAQTAGFDLLLGALRLAKEYAAHSGVASIQIGIMRQLGYVLPERYVYPFAARSPADFWRRWNTYVGMWARLYVFRPLTLALARRFRTQRRIPRSVQTVAIVLTFSAIGVLHDLVFSVLAQRVDLFATRWFTAVGCLVALWQALATHLRASLLAHGWLRHLERAAFAIVTCYAAAHLWAVSQQ